MFYPIQLLLLSLGALQGGLLSLWFFRNRHREPAHLYMSLLLLVVGLQLTLKVITKAWLFEHVRLLYLLSYQLPYLIGPLLFLYVSARQTHRVAWTDAGHFVPFGLVFLQICLLYAFPSIGLREFHPWFTATLQSLLLGVYVRWAWRRADPPLQSFVRGVAAAEFVIILTLALMVIFYGRFPDVRFLFVALTLLIYWVSYQVIAREGAFSHVSHLTPLPPATPALPAPLPKPAKYVRSSLKSDEADRIERQLRQAMDQGKLYLDASLNIDALAEKLDTTRHHLSQVLNERMQQPYADYMNALRLDEARQRLSNPAYFHYTIAAIAFDSGFSSLATFNDAFRRQYGMTPSRFREPFIKKIGV